MILAQSFQVFLLRSDNSAFPNDAMQKFTSHLYRLDS